MNKLILFITSAVLALVVSCNCKKEDDPKPSNARPKAYKAVQNRIEAADDTDFGDAIVTADIEEDGSGNAFIVIRYNPKYIQPVADYPGHSLKPYINYPAFKESYALQQGVASNACVNQALKILNRSSQYFYDESGVCEYIRDLRQLADDCAPARDEIQPVLDILDAGSDCL